METGKGYSSEPQPEKCHHCLCLAETQRQAGEWESFVVEKEGSVCPEEAASLGKLEAGHPRGLHGGHIWLFPAAPQLKAGTTVRDTVNYYSSPCCLGPIVTGFLSGFLDCLLETVVWPPSEPGCGEQAHSLGGSGPEFCSNTWSDPCLFHIQSLTATFLAMLLTFSKYICGMNEHQQGFYPEPQFPAFKAEVIIQPTL